MSSEDPESRDPSHSPADAVRRPHLSAAARIGCLVLIVAAALHAASARSGNGDLWIALASGRHIVGGWAENDAHRTPQLRLLDRLGIHISKSDPFSPHSRPDDGDRDDVTSLFGGSAAAARPNVGWVNQNWLSHVILHGLFAAAGNGALLAYLYIQLVLVGLILFRTALVLGAHPVLSAAITACGLLAARSFVDLRPNTASMLCAALLMLLLADWARGRPLTLLWLVPVQAFWANAHGGFVFAIVILSVFLAVHVGRRLVEPLWPMPLRRVGRRSLWILAAGLVLAVVIPMLASPFGQENLFHPLMITGGDDGKLWRTVNEWLPITHPVVFGNAVPYLVLLGAEVVAAGALFVAAIRRARSSGSDAPSPTGIDPAQLAALAVTVAMSFTSRRFVPLALVVLVPILAATLQQLAAPQAPFGARARLARTRQRAVEAALGVAALAMTCLFCLAMWDSYFRPSLDGRRLGVMEWMTGVNRQPAGALSFLEANGIRGVVLNNWFDGGYLAFHQQPDAGTGRIPLQVFIDGRAQAAYGVAHYRTYLRLRVTHPGDRAGLASADRALRQRGVNVVVISLRDEPDLFGALMKSRSWTPVLVEPPWIVLMRADAPENQAFLERGPYAIRYPDESTRALSLGYFFSRVESPALRNRALDLLMQVERDNDASFAHQQIYDLGSDLGRRRELSEYFAAQRDEYQSKVDLGVRLGHASHLEALLSALHHLDRLARDSGDLEASAGYRRKIAATRELWDDMVRREQRRLW